MKKQRSSRHPCEDEWLVRGRLPKIERSYFDRPQMLGSLQQAIEINVEGQVQAHSLRSCAAFPQPEHGSPSMSDPIEGDLFFRKHLGEFQSQRTTKERHRASQVGNRKMGLEQIANRNHRQIHESTHRPSLNLSLPLRGAHFATVQG